MFNPVRYLVLLFILPFLVKAQVDYRKLDGIWQNSVEERRGDTLVFRPQGYKLPRTRGREQMEFKNASKFIYYKIAPTDGYLKLVGWYELDKTSKELDVEYKDRESIVKNTFSIHSLTKDKLVLIYKKKE